MYWVIRSLNLHLTCQVQTLGPALLKCVDMQLPRHGKGWVQNLLHFLLLKGLLQPFQALGIMG